MKVILVNAVSVDGKIAISDRDELKWTGSEDKKWFAGISREAGVIIMGRKAYEVLGKPLNGRLIKVMTREPRKYKDIAGRIEFTGKSPKEILEELWNRKYQEVIIGGGVEINTVFFKGKLVNEIWLSMIPVVLGNGLGIFNDEIGGKVELQFLGLEKIGTSGVVLKYGVNYNL